MCRSHSVCPSVVTVWVCNCYSFDLSVELYNFCFFLCLNLRLRVFVVISLAFTECIHDVATAMADCPTNQRTSWIVCVGTAVSEFLCTRLQECEACGTESAWLFHSSLARCRAWPGKSRATLRTNTNDKTLKLHVKLEMRTLLFQDETNWMSTATNSWNRCPWTPVSNSANWFRPQLWDGGNHEGGGNQTCCPIRSMEPQQWRIAQPIKCQVHWKCSTKCALCATQAPLTWGITRRKMESSMKSGSVRTRVIHLTK